MKKFLLLSVIVSGFLWVSPASAQMMQQNQFQAADESHMMVESEGRVEGPHFRFDSTVVISENLSGDVYAAGEKVVINSDIDGDLMVAGKDVIINGNVSQDVRAAGMNVTINGVVGGNVSVAGATVDFGPQSQVMGSMIGGMQSAQLNGQVRGNVYMAAEDYDVNGEFNQDVMMHAGRLNLMKGAHIKGNLTAKLESPEAQVVNDQAQIDGQKDIQTYVAPERNRERDRQASQAWTGIKTSGLVMSLIVGFITAAVLLYLFPQAFRLLSSEVQTNTMGSLGWGFAYTILAPIAMILLAVTLVGLPLAGLLLVTYILSCVFAHWVVSLAVGQAIFKKYKFSWLKNQYAQLFGGLLVLGVIGLIPVVGWWVQLVVFFIGMGAIYLTFKNSIRKKGVSKK